MTKKGYEWKKFFNGYLGKGMEMFEIATLIL